MFQSPCRMAFRLCLPETHLCSHTAQKGRSKPLAWSTRAGVTWLLSRGTTLSEFVQDSPDFNTESPISQDPPQCPGDLGQLTTLLLHSSSVLCLILLTCCVLTSHFRLLSVSRTLCINPLPSGAFALAMLLLPIYPQLFMSKTSTLDSSSGLFCSLSKWCSHNLTAYLLGVLILLLQLRSLLCSKTT